VLLSFHFVTPARTQTRLDPASSVFHGRPPSKTPAQPFSTEVRKRTVALVPVEL
jgi:hypothetical protein